MKTESDIEPTSVFTIKPENRALVLRTCKADMTSYDGFTWPTTGFVEAPDWQPTAECGHGLHGLMDGWGDYTLLSNDADAKWLLLEVDRTECVEIGNKVKFPRANVIRVGDMADVLAEISKHQITLLLAATSPVEVNNAAQIGSSGDYAQIGSSGDYAQIGSSGDYAQIGSSGYSAQIGSSGNYAKIGSSGNYAKIGSSGNYAKIGSSGDSAKIGSSGNSAKIGSSGNSAQIEARGTNAVVAVAGGLSRFTLGEGGCIAVPYWDGTRTRFKTAYVGEDGIEAGVAYTLNSKHEFERVHV